MHPRRRSSTGLLSAALALAPAGLLQAGDFLDQHGMDAIQSDSVPAMPAASSFGAPIPAQRLLQLGDEVAPGQPVTVLNNPFSNDLGQFGFVGAFNSGAGNEHFVWLDGQVVWRNGDANGFVLSGGEGTMGISDDGDFIYSPSTDGGDSVWTRAGLLAVRGDAAPGFPTGAVSTFHSRPTMSANGAAHWVAGINYSGGTSSQARALYTATDATPATMTAVLRTGDIVDGVAIDSGGIGFNYWVSDDGAHRIVVLQLATGSTSDDTAVWVDGELVARESAATGDGETWSSFDAVSINNAGDYLFAGTSTGPTTRDRYLAYNGTIALREGDTIDGVTLATGAAVQTVSLNDLGQAAHMWNGSTDHLFFACDAADLANSIRLLSNGDEVDLDDDGLADATVTDINASVAVGPGLDLAEDGRVAINVDLNDGSGNREAIIVLAAPTCVGDTIFADGFETKTAP